ncbi:MAG: HPr family phosphocarrier protein [Sphingomonadales bacterium]|nr:HPr family phosphocarrier protein [Sphingomonadales bacterium]
MDASKLPVERALTIKNKRGLHARASAKFVTTANRFQADIKVAKDGMEVCGTSIMGLMMLAAAPGDVIVVRADGAQAAAAMQALEELVADKFGED